MAIQVLIDTSQRRLDKPRIGMTAEKLFLNGQDNQDAWVEPVGGTAMLRPAPLYPAWDTSNTGIYTRLTLTDFGITAGTDWMMVDNRGAGPVRIVRGTQMGASSIVTTASYGVNRGWFVSFYTYNIENSSDGVYFECGWDSGGTGAVGVSLQFQTNGDILVQKDGVILGGGNIGIQGGAAQNNVYANYLIIPMRRRDLLIYSLTSGDGFIFTFEDIAEDAVNPVILAHEPFWVYSPTASPNWELAPLQFETSGYLTSLSISLAVAPEVGRTLETRANGAIAPSVTNAYVLGDQPYLGAPDTTNVVSAVAVVDPAGSAFTPNGTDRDVLLKVSLAGDGDYTPFVYGVHAAYGATFEDTDDSEEFDITPYILANPAPVLSVPDDPGGVEFAFTIKAPETVESSDVALLLTLGNRPVRVMDGTNILLDGVMTEPEFEDASYDEAARLRCTVRDRMYIAQNLQLRERIPYDGISLSEAADPSVFWDSIIQFLYYSCGVANADMDLEALGFILPSIPNSDPNVAFNAQSEIGTTPYEEIARLVGTYAGGFVWGMVPQSSGANPKAVFLDPDTLSTTPDITLYRTSDDAVAASKPATQLYWTYTDQPLSIEANEVRCTGYNPRTRQVVQAYKVDTASQEVDTVPSLRPDNWLGEPRIFGVIDPRFTSEDACSRAVESIYPKVSARYWIGSFTSRMLYKSDGSPVWRGDLVALDGRRTLRISALTVEFVLEESGFETRMASYTGGTILNRGGSSVAIVSMMQQRASVTKSMIYPGGELIAAQTPGRTVEVP